MKVTNSKSWILRISIALIYIQTLYYKFTAHPDSVYLFTELGIEPVGRIGIGIFELITSILLLINRTKKIGIMLSLGIISGAILSHIVVIGTDVNGDSGTLFKLASIVFIASIVLLFLHKSEFHSIIKKK
jgi:putative oxidoreductase